MDTNLFMTNWIWTPDWSAEDRQETRIIYFRNAFELESIPSSLLIRISADSGYKLYVNGCFVQSGPQKALNLMEWYVDSAELTPFLKVGKNVVSVEVLRYPAFNGSSSHPNANDSLLLPNRFRERIEEAA